MAIRLYEYNLAVGQDDSEEHLGIGVEGSHYVINREDFFSCRRVTGKEDGSRLNPAVFRLVGYNAKTRIATLEEVTGRNLISKIVEEFCAENVSDEEIDEAVRSLD